ncbi:glycosyltransferase family 2 protein [Montanilutibacter psychrotolerans]|uniref:Glycosyltransferase family 2 protein n=1 Tax=Montanilutibacter psychrotolerans TaxID=1327343 RepID=A0A3M8SSI1_9GAMM|nr:glycosyltransferase family 2 protein [Lysobacter psychrotolerans]RNF84269.1 glycosyltransferase family 2 protein [Lysobacter psychrotolerans]
MPTSPLLTTVIPTYRRPQLLRRAILSAIEQDGVEVCVRVCDNASGDGTREVVAGLAAEHPQVAYHCHPQNVGAVANFAFGVRDIQTPFFSLLSDDDYLLPQFYQRALAGLAANPRAMFWVGTTLNVDADGRIWDARMDRWPRDGMYLQPEGAMAMTAGMAPTWIGIVFRREVLEQLDFLDPETLGPSDLDYTLRLAARFPFVVERVPVAVFTLNASSISATQPMAAFWPGWLRMFQKVPRYEGLTDADRDRLLAALKADARRMLFRRGVHALAAGRRDFAREAATALARDCSRRLPAMALRALAGACEHIPGVQSALSWGYRKAEMRIVASRGGLQQRYGHLLRDP